MARIETVEGRTCKLVYDDRIQRIEPLLDALAVAAGVNFYQVQNQFRLEIIVWPGTDFNKVDEIVAEAVANGW